MYRTVNIEIYINIKLRQVRSMIKLKYKQEKAVDLQKSGLKIAEREILSKSLKCESHQVLVQKLRHCCHEYNRKEVLPQRTGSRAI